MKGYEHLAEADARQLGRKTVATPKPSKHRNVRVEVDGLQFQSKREADYWLVLKAREKAGEIRQLARQVAFDLYAPDRVHRNGMAQRVAQYVADYTYLEMGLSGYPNGLERVVDAKGQRTAMYKLKKKWLELQDGIVIEEV